MKIRKRLQLIAGICLAVVLVCGVCDHLLPVKVPLDGHIEEMWIEMYDPIRDNRYFTVTEPEDISLLVQAIRKAVFRKAFVISYEPPDSIFARIFLSEKEETGMSIQVTKGPDKKLRYLLLSEQGDFCVYNGKEITAAIQSMIDDL